MTLTSVLSNALSGLSAAQRALGTISNNIANSSTEGYNRKEIQQSTRIVDGRGVGVQNEEAIRVIDEFLAAETRRQANTYGKSNEVEKIHDRIQASILGSPVDGDRGISNRINKLVKALETLANSPEKSSLRSNALGAVQDLVDQMSIDAGKIQDLRSDADRSIAQTVNKINLDVKALESINAELARAIPSAELLDKRDALVLSLSENIDVSTYYNDNGTVAVLTSAGVPLLEYSAYTMVYNPASSVSETTSFGALSVYPADQIDPATGDPKAGASGFELVSSGVRRSLTPELQADAVPDASQTITSQIQGGRIAGLLEARDKILPELADQYGELASITQFQLNAAHNNAVPSPPPNSLDGSRTDFTGYNAANNSGTAYIAVIDNTTGNTLTTVSIDATLASPAAIVTQLNTDLAGYGTATFGPDGNLQIDLTNPDHGLALNEGDSAIEVTDDAGHVRNYGAAHYFGLNDLIVQDGASPVNIDVRSDIKTNSSLISNVVLTVDSSGATPVGTVGSVGDNRGIQHLAKTLQSTISTIDRGTLPGSERTVSSYMSNIVSLVSVAADSAKTENASNKALADNLASRMGTVSGVSLDEELSKLIVYQQAYTVSARLISVTDEMFETLLNGG